MSILPKSLVALLLTCCLVASSNADQREWKDNTGQYTIVAELVDVKDQVAFLKKENGNTIKVPFSRLSKADVEFLEAYVKARDEAAKPKTEPKPTAEPKPKTDPAPKVEGAPKATPPPKMEPGQTAPASPETKPADSKPLDQPGPKSGSPGSTGTANPANAQPAVPMKTKAAGDEATTTGTAADPKANPAGANPPAAVVRPKSVRLKDANVVLKVEPARIPPNWAQQVPAALVDACGALAAEPPEFPAVREALDQIREAWPNEKNPALVALVRHALTIEEKFCRLKALQILIEHDPIDSFGFIMSMGTDASQDIRWATFNFAGAAQNKAVVPMLVDLFAGPDRSKIAHTLEKFGSIADEMMLKHLDNDSKHVRQEACQLLGKIGTEKVIPRLQQASESDENVLVKLQARSAISKIKARLDSSK